MEWIVIQYSSDLLFLINLSACYTCAVIVSYQYHYSPLHDEIATAIVVVIPLAHTLGARPSIETCWTRHQAINSRSD